MRRLRRAFSFAQWPFTVLQQRNLPNKLNYDFCYWIFGSMRVLIRVKLSWSDLKSRNSRLQNQEVLWIMSRDTAHPIRSIVRLCSTLFISCVDSFILFFLEWQVIRFETWIFLLMFPCWLHGHSPAMPHREMRNKIWRQSSFPVIFIKAFIIITRH